MDRHDATFGDLLRRHRLLAGLSQGDLAERARVSPNAIGALERGINRKPFPRTIALLADALGLGTEQRAALVAAARSDPGDAPRRSTPGGTPGPDRTGGSIPSNLPAATTSFVGRARELSEVTERLHRTRLLTLTGTGGCGKTRLALQVAVGLLERYPDGVWFVDLAPLADPRLVAQTAAVALGVPERTGRPIVESLATHLEGKELLLLLDNCEHLIEAAAQLAHALLRACPRVRVLATSREALGLAGETSWRVPSLPLPPAHGATVDEVTRSDAACLFVERARAVRPGFALAGANAATVAQICRRLDGIPLALELAAARVRVLSVEQIAQRLDDRFRLLTGGSRDVLPRQQTLRATLDWSYHLLGESERALFRRLAVFAGGFGLEAAEAVGAPAGDGPGDVLDWLTQLVDKSLVLVEERAEEARYRLLETVRQYGQERLVEADEAPVAQDRHRDWYLGLAERAEPELGGPGQQEWRARLDVEHDNLRAALAWSLERDPATGVRLAGSLATFWSQRGNYAEGRRWLEEALARASAAGSPADQRARARALAGAGVMANELLDRRAGRAFTEESLALFRALGDQQGVASVLRTHGLSLLRGGAPAEQVQVTLEESADLARALGDRRGVAVALLFLGCLAARERDDPRARRLLDEALALAREVGDAQEISNDLALRGWFLWGRGELVPARRDLEEGLEVARRLGNKRGVGTALLALGCLAHGEGDRQRARALLEESARLFQETDNLWIFYQGLAYLGHRAVDEQRYAAGARLLAFVVAEYPEYVVLASLLPPAHPAERDVALAEARAALGEEAFAAAWAAGRALTLEQALAYGLEEDGA